MVNKCIYVCLLSKLCLYESNKFPDGSEVDLIQDNSDVYNSHFFDKKVSFQITNLQGLQVFFYIYSTNNFLSLFEINLHKIYLYGSLGIPKKMSLLFK